ncbi:PD-(D/E)XK motif protein, partial [Ectothiorhodospira haloalkaliphila]|uniref:PD-(D/E)XK motif protein n=1 Tax=Ectothiorhodospira haloalkaliphila TaxID=421628 RepID=UPI001EE9167B
DIELRSVSVHFSRDCMVEAAEGEAATGIYTVVRLNENDPDTVRMLLRLLDETFRARKTPYTNKEIAARIVELADLFKQIGDSTGDIVGLWGELYILSRASSLQTAVQCWCLKKNAKYDYVTEGFALEAKTTVRSRRKHRFSLDQLRPNDQFRVYIASLAVVELNSGHTAADLMDEMCGKIGDDDLRARFLAQCLIKGGRDIYRNTLKLGVFPDGTSLMVLDASTIPVPEIAQPSLIENVRFDVDLTDLSPISRRELDTVLTFGRA